MITMVVVSYPDPYLNSSTILFDNTILIDQIQKERYLNYIPFIFYYVNYLTPLIANCINNFNFIANGINTLC